MKNLVMYVKSNKKAKIIATIVLCLLAIVEYFGVVMLGLYALLALLTEKFSMSIIGVMFLLPILVITVFSVLDLYGKLRGGDGNVK